MELQLVQEAELSTRLSTAVWDEILFCHQLPVGRAALASSISTGAPARSLEQSAITMQAQPSLQVHLSSTNGPRRSLFSGPKRKAPSKALAKVTDALVLRDTSTGECILVLVNA